MTKVLKGGMQNGEVLRMQNRLSDHGFIVQLDGNYSLETAFCVANFQRANDLKDDGICGPITTDALNKRPEKPMDWPTLEGPSMLRKVGLSHARNFTERMLLKTYQNYGELIYRICNYYSYDPVRALAVFSTESAGEPWGYNDKPLVRFENHIFVKRFSRKHGTSEFISKFFDYDAKQHWKNHVCTDKIGSFNPHESQKNEWRAIELASKYDPELALKSASWGMPQIMGFNHTTAGFSTVDAMVNAFSASDEAQVEAFYEFVINMNSQNDRSLFKGIGSYSMRHDLKQFVSLYNGPGQVDRYTGFILDREQIALEYKLFH